MNNILTFPNGSTITLSEAPTDVLRGFYIPDDNSITLDPKQLTEAINASEPIYNSLESFMKRNKLSSQDKIKQILDNQARIKYYLEEIEMFGPRRR